MRTGTALLQAGQPAGELADRRPARCCCRPGSHHGWRAADGRAARAAAPVIHWLSPDAVRDAGRRAWWRASDVTSGRPSRSRSRKPALISPPRRRTARSRRRCRPRAAARCPARRRADRDPRSAARRGATPAAISASAQGGVLPQWRARLERDIGGGAARLRAGARQRLGLGMRAAARLRPAAADDAPSLTMTQPTVGLGQVAPSAAARQRERRACIAGRSRSIPRPVSAQSSPSTVVPMRDELLEILGLAEIAIDRGEAHIGDLIERRAARPSPARRSSSLGISLSPELSSWRTMPLTTRSTRSGSTGRLRSATWIERASLSRSKGTRWPFFLTTVSSRSCTRSKVVKRGRAIRAEAPPADRRAVVGRSRILNLGVLVTAEWTAHLCPLFSRLRVGQSR